MDEHDGYEESIAGGGGVEMSMNRIIYPSKKLVSREPTGQTDNRYGAPTSGISVCSSVNPVSTVHFEGESIIHAFSCHLHAW